MDYFRGLPPEVRELALALQQELGPRYGARSWALAKALALEGHRAGFLPGYYLAYDESGWPVVLWAEPVLAKAEPLAPGERWVTLKPHGPDSPDYVRVKIRVWPDGTAHVVAGPKGLLGLRLSRLGEGPKKKAHKPSKEEREARRQAQEAYRGLLQEAHRQAVERARALLDHPALERLADPEGLKAELRGALEAHAQALGEDPGAARGGAARAAALQLRRLKGALRRLEEGLLRHLAQDEEARRAVLGPKPVPQKEEPQGGLGYAPDLGKRAQARGYGEAEARAEAERVRQEELASLPPEEAERKIQASLRAKEAAAVSRTLAPVAERLAPVPTPKPKPEEVLAKAEAVRGFLEAMRRVREAERQARLAAFGRGDPEAREALERALERTRYPIHAEEVDPEALRALEAQVEDLSREEALKGFLEEAHRLGEPDWTPGEVRRAMARFHRAGVYAHLADVGHVLLGREPVDRLVVDALGPDAAVALTARALLREVPKERLEAVLRALEGRHEELLARIPEAQARAREALEAARRILPEGVEGEGEAALTEGLLRERRRLLEEARREIGGLLGQIEASALLQWALRTGGVDRLEVDFGERGVTEAAPILRGLGLEEGDYAWEREGGRLKAILHPQGMDRLLLEAPDPEEQKTLERLKAIRAGAEDEEDWLPAGFVRYPRAALDAQAEVPKPLRYASPPDWSRGYLEGIRRFVGERLADGWTPLELKRALSSMDFIRDWVPEGEEGAYLEALEAVLPTYAGEVERRNRQGEVYRVKVPVDYAHLEKYPELHGRLVGLAREVAGRDAYPDETLEDTPEVRRALYLALLEDPRLQVGHKPLGDLTREDQAALRSYYLTEILGLSPEELAQRKEAARKALEKYDRENPEPPKWGAADPLALFASEEDWNPARPITLRFRTEDPYRRRRLLRALGLRKEGEDYTVGPDGSITLTERGKEKLTPVSDPEDLAALEGDLPLSPQWRRWWMGRKRAAAEALGERDLVEWPEFVELLGGTGRAYAAVQEHMRGRLAGRFAGLHARLTGRPLRLSKRENPYGEHLWAIQDPESYREFRERQREAMEGLRAREKGRFAHMGGRGSLLEAYRAMREAERAGRGAQASLFGLGAAGDPRLEPEEPIPFLERPALAPGVENRLAALTREVVGGLRPGMNPVRVIPDLTMGRGTPYVKQQRAIRSIIAGRKQALFLGVGSGKTAVSLGAFTELHARGEARKGLFVVPSIVRNQFGEEMARFLEPGRYLWHAHEAPAHERIAALRDPNLHLVATTHQAFRDDLLRLMAEHHGEELEAFKERFLQAPLSERQRLMREALEAHGIPLDYLALDEAHDALNRRGKEESLLSAVLDTAMSLARYGVLMTGTPVKNDASEMGDWLRKLDPERFGDQEAFLRRYGTDARVAREALKRLSERYTYHDAVPSGTKKKEVWGDERAPGPSPTGHALIPLHPQQLRRVEEVERAYRRARQARARGGVDLEALRTLSPESFAGVPEERHLEVAQGLNRSLGVLRHAAIARAIDEAPAEGNAKVAHLLELAEARRGRGGVVFATRRKAVEEIARALERAGHRVAVLHGGHSAEEKARIRQRFDRGEVDILVLSDAGATGANLQGRGEWLVHYDIPMTWKTFEQRTARIDRLGQRKPIEVHTLMTDTDHDRAAYRRIREKRLLGEIWHGPYEHMDDRGLALQLRLAGRGGEDEYAA